MGTLTADSARLPEYCDHKLPTSCRLTSIPDCCACADERAHAASYSTYIDGIGFVLRGTRWQRYCWFCKEFWENRVNVSGLRPGQTKIPEVPDQTAFLERWYEFHQGFRTVKNEEGGEERVAVLGEDFKDVSPGSLPRTLEEMRTGRREVDAIQQPVQQIPTQAQNAGPNLEDTLEQMFEAATIEELQTQPAQRTSTRHGAQQHHTEDSRGAQSGALPNSIHAQVMNPAGSRSRDYQLRRVAALRRELNRMRTGIERVISGLRDLGEEVPNQTETTERLSALGTTLESIGGTASQEQAAEAMNNVNSLVASTGTESSDRTSANMQARVDEARAAAEEARRSRDQVAAEFDLAETEFRSAQQRLQQVQRDQRTTDNYTRLFGTREEMIAAGEDYESPIGGMFTRAEARFHAAEEMRAEERILRAVLADEVARGGEVNVRRLLELEEMNRDVWGVPQAQNRPLPSNRHNRDIDQSTTPPHLTATGDENMLQQYYAMVREQERQQQLPAGEQVDAGEGATTLEEWATGTAPTDDFPQSMLNAIRTVRAQGSHSDIVAADSMDAALHQVENTPPNALDVETWWNLDAEHLVRRLTTDAELRNELAISSQEASSLLSGFLSDIVSETDRTIIDGLLRNSVAIWRSRLPTEWLARRRVQITNARTAEDLLFSSAELEVFGELGEAVNRHLNVELIAQAYQMSGEVRRRATQLNPPERLQMLYRLQAGARSERDRAVLENIVEDGNDRRLAFSTYARTFFGEDTEDVQWSLRRRIDDQRRSTARDGDFSRSELDSRRRETAQAFALAAGRQAMQTGSDTLMERAAAREAAGREGDVAGTRAAFRRLHENHLMGRPSRVYHQLTLSDYLNEGTSESGSDNEEEEEARGLDAADSGRPEAKADEDLKVQMECKICYTQLAEIACLPCGHLVMCKWCSEQHSPCLPHDRTRPRRAAACPVCRKGIRQKVRVYRA